ncbi:hypothetical protein ACFIOY_08830 [Bradyrhizobium sp. TZ2]
MAGRVPHHRRRDVALLGQGLGTRRAKYAGIADKRDLDLVAAGCLAGLRA